MASSTEGERRNQNNASSSSSSSTEQEKRKDVAGTNDTTNLGAFAQLLAQTALLFSSLVKEFISPQAAMFGGSFFLPRKAKELRQRCADFCRDFSSENTPGDNDDNNNELRAFLRQTREEEKATDFLHFEKKTKILREITETCAEILAHEEVYQQGGRRKVAVKALECLFLVMNFVEKEKVRVSGASESSESSSSSETMTCSATMLRDACKAVAFCGKDDNALEITRMVVKMLLALATSEHIVNSGTFQGEEGEEALEILTLRLAHSAVASEGDVERRVAKTALVQHINNSFKRCADVEFKTSASAENATAAANGVRFFCDLSALTCLKALCKIASRDSDDAIATIKSAEENTDTKGESHFSAANALDADEYILASRFLAIDLLRQLCEGPNARAWLAAYRNELKKPLSEALLVNAMLNPKSTLQKGGVAGVAAAAAATASGTINNNGGKRLSFEGIERTLNASTNRTNITTSTSNNSTNILHGFNNATRFHPMALASSSLARATFAAIVSRARDSWKSEIALMFPTMLLHPLERSKSTHVKAKIAALKTLRQIYDDPSTAADVFVNYDCDPRCSTNCFERSAKAILETLKVEREKERILVNTSSGSSIDIDSVAVRDAATQCLVAIVRSLRVWRARNKELGEDLFHDEDSIDEVERKASSSLRRSGSVSTSFELIPSQNVVVSSGSSKSHDKKQPESSNATKKEPTKSEELLGGGLLSSVPLENENAPTITSSSSSTAKPSQTKTFATLKKEKRSVEIAVKKFNKTPTMAVLREHAPSNSVVSASDAAKFLRSAPGVDPSAIGHLLGSSDADGVAVIRAYLENFDFTNEYVDEALRKFMSTFRIPGEAQQIDRLTECFAKRFIELNPNFGGEQIEKKVDCVTIIAFAIIMLNTDAHNPMVDVKMRMSREDFLNMALDTPETKGLEEEMIRGVYDRVTKEEIILSADKRAIAETSSSTGTDGSSTTTTTTANSGLMSDFGIFGAFKKKQKILEMEEKIASEEAKALLRETARAFSAVTTRPTTAPVTSTLSSPQLENGQGSNSELDEGVSNNNNNNNNNLFVSESAFHAAAEAGLARPMFEVIGEALCRALSIAFGLANDPGRAAMALECARSAMRLAFETKLYTLRDLFGQFLCNATGVSASDNDQVDGNADDNNDDDDDVTRVDSRAMQRAEATKTLLDCARSDVDFIKLGQKFWKSCIDICVSLEIAMLENDSTALRGVTNVNSRPNGTAQESTDGNLPDTTKVEKNIQRLLGFKNIMAWLRPFSRESGLETDVNPDAKAAIDACFVNSTRMDASELSHLVDALIQRSERDLSAAEQSEITKSPNTRIAMKRLADVARANLDGRSLAAWRNVIWGPASLHLATTATSCVQIETLVNRNACKEASECLRVVAEAVLLKRGSTELDETEDEDGNVTPTKRKTKLTKLETDEDIINSNVDAAREDAMLPFYEAIRTIANSSFRNSGLGNETVFFDMKTRKAEFVVDALRRLAKTSSRKFGKSWRRVAQTLEIVASNATLSEYHGNTEEYDGNPEDQVKVLFADSAKIRAFVSFRNIIVESVLKGRSKKDGVSTSTPSSSDGELTDDILPDIVDVLAKFRDVEKQTKNDKGESIVISEALLSLQEIIVRADRSTPRGRNLWKATTRRLISATFSIENTRATTMRAFESVFASALDFTTAESKTRDDEKLFWQDVCEVAIEPIVSFTREEYYGNHAHRSAPKNEGFLEAKTFSLATFFPRLVSNVTSSKNSVGYDIVSVGFAKAIANLGVASTSLAHLLSCIAAFGAERSTSSPSESFWSFVCDFLENAFRAQEKNERDDIISKSLVCDFIPELYSSCGVAESQKRIAHVASTIHIDAFSSAIGKEGGEEHEELLCNSTRAVLATTTNDVSGTLTACDIVLRYYFLNNEKKTSSFDISARVLDMLASVVDALTTLVKQNKTKAKNNNSDGAKVEEGGEGDISSSLSKQKKEISQLFVPQLSSLVALGRYPLNRSLQSFFSATLEK